MTVTLATWQSSAILKTHGFASQPHDWFAFFKQLDFVNFAGYTIIIVKNVNTSFDFLLKINSLQFLFIEWYYFLQEV